jgi:imidazolonepropionase-like amidohydrolase
MTASAKTVLVPLALAILATPLPSQDLVAVKASRIITVSGADLADAVILVRNGKIDAVGADVEVPWNAKVIDATGKVVMPTWVLAHTSGGIGGSNEQMANVPFLTVADSVDPSSEYFEEGLRNGIGCMHVIPGENTLIGGSGMVVRPYGRTVEEMTLRTRGGLKLSLAAPGGSRIAQIRKLHRALQDAADAVQELARKKQEFEREKAAGAAKEQEFNEKLDEKQQPVADLLDGKIRGFLYVPSAAEISEVARLRADYPKLDLVLVLGPACYKAADRIKELGLPAVLDDTLEHWETDPETEAESMVAIAKVFADAGVPLVFSIARGATGPTHYPWWQVATAIRGGVDRSAAVRALTLEAAKVLGLDGELGSIEPGKVANLQILTGDPLQVTTWVETVLLEGEVAYERATDARLKHLFGLEKND